MSTVAFPSISVLPVELMDVKLRLQAMKKKPELVVQNPSTPTAETALKFERVIFEPNSKLIFTSLDTPYIVLYADVVVFNGKSEITRQPYDDLTGSNGTDAPPTPPTPKGDGRNGNDGQPGGQGGAAQNPLRMPIFFLLARQFLWVDRQASPSDVRNNVALSMDGLDGGVGGTGGRGGDGTNGNKGERAHSGLFWCDSGVGRGGRGGNGGAGGMRGFGSNGGDASAVYLIVDPQQHSIAEAFSVSTKGGMRGNHGKNGISGRPGRGGDPGEPDNKCSAEPDRKGADGQITRGCIFPNIDLLNGADHKNSPGIIDYDGWDELGE